MSLTRRDILAAAALLGATPVWASGARRSTGAWHEARERFPQGVASGDPDAGSVLLWCRVEPSRPDEVVSLRIEIARDPTFEQVVATHRVRVAADADWTCRVLVAGLAPDTLHWYRFTDADGRGSRIGRTRTAPEPGATRSARFAFVSCQNRNVGHLHAWRRMRFDDERAAPDAQIDFVLHLGDFVYDTVWYPEDRPRYFDRAVRNTLTYPTGERHGDFHVPVDLRDYRALYRAYLDDPDLQDARARWPFVAIWDNGEYSDKGWQGLQYFEGTSHPAQSRKVAANQAWFEYMPARVRTADGSLARFAAPRVADNAVTTASACRPTTSPPCAASLAIERFAGDAMSNCC